MSEIDDLARVFKALSDPNRLAILQLVRERGSACCGTGALPERGCVSEIAEEFDLALSTVSHHVKELKNAGLIQCVKRGQWVYCLPNLELLKKVSRFVAV